MKTIMVFGATGLLGAYISLHFHGKGWKVIAVGRRKAITVFAGYGIPYYSVDIIMKDEFGKLPKDHIDVVAHFAGDLPASMEGYDGIRYIDSILKGTYNVLQFMHENGIPKSYFHNHCSISVTFSAVRHLFLQIQYVKLRLKETMRCMLFAKMPLLTSLNIFIKYGVSNGSFCDCHVCMLTIPILTLTERVIR